MNGNRPVDISKLFVTGINYKKTDASIRGQFAINSDQYSRLFTSAPQNNITEFFVLSTCNRTEIYGFADHNAQLSELLCSETEGSHEQFREISYTKRGLHAIEHLFEVAAGL